MWYWKRAKKKLDDKRLLVRGTRYKRREKNISKTGVKDMDHDSRKVLFPHYEKLSSRNQMISVSIHYVIPISQIHSVTRSKSRSLFLDTRLFILGHIGPILRRHYGPLCNLQSRQQWVRAYAKEHSTRDANVVFLSEVMIDSTTRVSVSMGCLPVVLLKVHVLQLIVHCSSWN